MMNGFFPPARRTGQRKAFGALRAGFQVWALAALLPAGFLPAAARGQAEGLLSSLGVFLEPKFTSPAAWHEIPGAKETVLVAARQSSLGATALSSAEWKAGALKWPEVFASAVARATRLEQAMTVQWQRDSRKVYQYAWIESTDPFISSVIYSPGFLGHFRQFFGDEVLVVVPERLCLYVFPRYGKPLDVFGPALVRRYQDASLKVSLEVLLVDGIKAPRVIGKIAH